MSDTSEILASYSRFLNELEKKYDIELIHKVIWEYEKTFHCLVKELKKMDL